jgi:nucleotide-binding universal stress UspA family protein
MGRIVVGVDGSETSRRALRWALDEAKLRGDDLTAVNAWHYPYAGATELAAMVQAVPPETAQAEARGILEAAAREVAQPGDPEADLVTVCGGPASVLVEQAKGADLLVVGSRGLGGFAGLLLGSVSHQVTHHAPCPVVVVPAGP